MKITLKATNPLQYDSPELDWRIGGAEDRTSRKYFREELETTVSPSFLQDKRVIDIGSGVGQLFNWLKNHGATEVVGIDPSRRNTETSLQTYPWATSVNTTLQEYAAKGSEKFDSAFALLVFEHIHDLESAFQDVASLLNENGEFYLIITDKDYNVANNKELRGKNFIKVEILQDLGEGAVEARTFRDEGDKGQTVLYDIFRPLEQVREAAKSNGFKLIKERPLLGPYNTPPAERTFVICHLLVFKKS